MKQPHPAEDTQPFYWKYFIEKSTLSEYYLYI